MWIEDQTIKSGWAFNSISNIFNMRVHLNITYSLYALFSALYSSSCKQPLSVLLSLPFPLTTTFMQVYSALLLFPSSISHLQNALQQMSSWMTANLLTLNSSKTEFSSDSKTNLPKYTTLHLTPPTLLKILASSLTNILLSLTKLHLSPKPVTITFVNFAVFGLTSIRQLPVPLLHLSSTPNWITVILSTINSQSLN